MGWECCPPFLCQPWTLRQWLGRAPGSALLPSRCSTRRGRVGVRHRRRPAGAQPWLPKVSLAPRLPPPHTAVSSRSGGRGGARPAPASPETQGLLARLLVQQRARALLGPKPSAGPAVARGPDSAVLAAARGSSVVGDARGGAATARAPARRGRGLAEGWAGARPEGGGGEAQLSPHPRAAVGTASPRKRGLREAGGGGGPASPAGAALLQGAGTQRSPAKSADIRRYVEQGSPGRLGATACEGGELDLTTPEGCCRSPAIDLTQT